MEDVNKRIGGSKRANVARENLVAIFSDPSNSDYLLKDIEYARRFDVTRHTIASIRDQFKIPPRTERILTRLKSIDTESMTIKEIGALLNIKYQNLYKIIKENDIKVKPDTKPIEHLKEHAKNRRLKMLELIEKSGIISDLEEQLEDVNIIQPPEIGRRKGRSNV
jgi:hypothetical protein